LDQPPPQKLLSHFYLRLFKRPLRSTAKHARTTTISTPHPATSRRHNRRRRRLVSHPTPLSRLPRIHVQSLPFSFMTSVVQDGACMLVLLDSNRNCELSFKFDLKFPLQTRVLFVYMHGSGVCRLLAFRLRRGREERRFVRVDKVGSLRGRVHDTIGAHRG